MTLWWEPLLAGREAGALGWMGGVSTGAVAAGAGSSARQAGGRPTAVSPSLAAGSCQDATGLRTAPRTAEGQRLLSRRGHHPRLARAGERGFPLPAHQRRGGLLRPHTVGPRCCLLPDPHPSTPEPEPHSRLLSRSLSSSLPSSAWQWAGCGEPQGSLGDGWQCPSSCQGVALRPTRCPPRSCITCGPQTEVIIQAGEAGQWEPGGTSVGVRVTPSPGLAGEVKQAGHTAHSTARWPWNDCPSFRSRGRKRLFPTLSALQSPNPQASSSATA